MKSRKGKIIPKMEDAPAKGAKAANAAKQHVEKKWNAKPRYERVARQGVNNIKWRTEDVVMSNLVAKLPFGLAAGLRQNLGITGLTDTRETTYEQPGILAVKTLVTSGASSDYNSALNLAVRKIYSYVRHANSGSRNYEAADMGVYFIALQQALAYLGNLQRGYRIVREYSTTNRYKPSMLLTALGFNAADLIAHQPQLKYLIAWFGRAIGSLAFPKMNIFEASYEAFKYIYVDNDSPKEQFYVLTPARFGVYNPTYTTLGGGVDFNNVITWPNGQPATRKTVADLITDAHAILDVLLSDEDCGIISGDILKAFGDNELFVPSAFGDEYEVFQHSPEFLQQVHNLTVIDEGLSFRFDGYEQQSGGTNTAPFITNKYFSAPSSGYTGSTAPDCLAKNLFIDAFSKDPDAEEVVNCTVLNPQARILSNGATTPGYYYDPASIAYDLFLPVGCYLYAMIDENNAISDSTLDMSVDMTKWRDINNTGFSTLKAGLTNFDWHPLIIRKRYVSGYTTNRIYVVGDMQNFRIFEYDVGKRIHDNSILSLFNFQSHNFAQSK